LGRNITPLPMVYSMILCKGYIQITLFPRISKWESQNYDFYYLETLDVHIYWSKEGLGMQLRIIGIPPLAFSPTYESVFHSWTHSLGLMCSCTPHLVDSNVRVMTRLPLGFSLPSSFYTLIKGIRVLDVLLGSLSFTSFFPPKTFGWWCSTHECLS